MKYVVRCVWIIRGYFYNMKTVSTKTESKKSIARRIGTINASEAISGFTKKNRVTGLTNGAFSLISLIDAVLDITGEANVIISTWSAGFYDVTAVNQLIESGKIKDFKIILDRSYKSRQAQYSATVEELFGLENIRITNTHAKFVLIQNEEWNVCIRSSMNLNENKRCENFDVDNDIDVYNLFFDFVSELFKIQQKGIIEKRGIIDANFDKLFPDNDFDLTFDFNLAFD